MANQYNPGNMESTFYIFSNVTGSCHAVHVPSQRGAFEANYNKVREEERGKGLTIPGNDLRARLTAPNGSSLKQIITERNKQI